MTENTNTPILIPQTETVTAPKVSRRNMTSYWGVSLRRDPLDIPQVKQILSENPNLIINKGFHVTLLYVGKKINDNEAVFLPYDTKECQVEISGFGYSDDALALKVNQVICDDVVLPFFGEEGKKMHVTVALKTGIKPVDSVKTLHDTNKDRIVDFPENIVLKGWMKRFLY